MYKILTSGDNKSVIDTVLLNNEEDYLLYIEDNNLKEEYGFKEIMFGKPNSYPAILVTHFAVSLNIRCPHRVYGEYIYISSFS
jgi:hypothetical protein